MSRQSKSDRLKKLEQMLQDLEQWMKLGLVPKADLKRHSEEIEQTKAKIAEERERLEFIRNSGDEEEYVAPKRQPQKTIYTEMPTIPDADPMDRTISDTAFDSESHTESDDTNASESKFGNEDEESFFSDKRRWKRGARDIVDPDASDW